MPIYENSVIHKVSVEWLHWFKKRYKIKNFVLNGKSESADDGEETTMLMQEIQEILSNYKQKYVYNIDESELYWKQASNFILATEQQEGIK